MNKEEDFYKCNQCGGYGWVIIPDHTPECSSENGCSWYCPIPVKAPCDVCGGAGCIPIKKEEEKVEE